MTRSAVLTAAALSILAVQAVASHFLRHDPYLPSPPPLSAIPAQIGNWTEVSEELVPPAALEMLGPDDSLARIYQSSESGQEAELFVVYYKSQLGTKNAHDPKVCLPGAGWNPIDSHLAQVPLSGSKGSFPVNYYRIKRGADEQVVLYWFQTFNAVYTFEQQLRLHKLIDTIRDNRSDMALVRVTVPVSGQGLAKANSVAVQLAQIAHSQMLPYFAPTEKSGS